MLILKMIRGHEVTRVEKNESKGVNSGTRSSRWASERVVNTGTEGTKHNYLRYINEH